MHTTQEFALALNHKKWRHKKRSAIKSLRQRSFSKTECGAPGIQFGVEPGPAPVNHDTAREEVWHVKIIEIVIPNNRAPTVDRIPRKMSTKDFGVELLDFQELGESKAIFEHPVITEMLVQKIPCHQTILLISMDPPLK
ncbi:hypothetical protein A3C89_00055 [Candidatus Kaiserbacteria bacterium RIFCSPHIGHO2_02_FULL_50_50]|uniref:Uncharacterized protein n=1 Tax=Candidatus Kaiserbacteria bacterium RIFCSPHIGHO2_02_FULL_50_50 TaxID=1798492 RepID=A0A1F6DGT3_9BACT|nr:MAG: hypothetical protein A3C89_00055 [Candidatus Kaiserbacteria bacterium RIFCSPHIGHO2_02_FULL_50_50]OGG88209.1 MAG: hypothetical protein A3G62_00445 [Candidatus Kaiserbacteria bacterium RIFCSPLOWO2_12_FULL_50_10]